MTTVAFPSPNGEKGAEMTENEKRRQRNAPLGSMILNSTSFSGASMRTAIRLFGTIFDLIPRKENFHIDIKWDASTDTYEMVIKEMSSTGEEYALLVMPKCDTPQVPKNKEKGPLRTIKTYISTLYRVFK